MSDRSSYPPQWSLQLAPLASQHHLSEYSRIKYGHRGCPVSYSPLSLHLPDVVRRLRERQQKYANQVLWWPCATPASSPQIPAAQQRAALVAGEPVPHPELQLQLANALSDSIPSHHRHPSHVKTSESHPINVSHIIPPDSLVALSSRLTPSKTHRPVLFDIHLPYTLDRIAGYPEPPIFLPPIPPLSPPILHRKYPPSTDHRLTGVLNAALSTKITLPSLPVPSSRVFLSLKRNLKVHTISGAPSQSDPNFKPASSSQLPALHPLTSHLRPPTAPSPPHKISKSRPSKSSSHRQGTTHQRPFKLGNLLLSSCPGKKVRLSGPVRGRSAVCRDLDLDLRRMKMMGARCVVCCLDDEELEFLIGVSWTEYCRVAHQEGLDVLRIPLPEGLAPLSPRSLDTELDRVIERYTLQGISVLVHCRGGVGRAGLFASCWLLKLGLCGWIETENTANSGPPQPFRWDGGTVVRRDTLQLVERVIEVVRRRRSVKAIETLEQVQFLVEYVDYLRTSSQAVQSNIL